MNTLLFPLFDFVAKNKWAQYLILCVTGLIIVRMWLWFHDDKVRKLQKDQHKAEQAQVRTEIVQRTTEIITEERHNADEALEARDSGSAPATFDELPESHKAIARGRARAHLDGGS
jgi:hypothetical protein